MRTNRQPLTEGLGYKDLEGILKPSIHVDEFSSKMGDDDDIIVLSFYVKNKAAAKDLTNWFEKGYDFVLDADQSPGEIKPNRFLVYVEMRRRNSAPNAVQTLLDDLSTLCEFDADEWEMVYKKRSYPWSEETFTKLVPTTPKDYRKETDSDLNEWRVAAGIKTKPLHDNDREMQKIKSAAGIL